MIKEMNGTMDLDCLIRSARVIMFVGGILTIESFYVVCRDIMKLANPDEPGWAVTAMMVFGLSAVLYYFSMKRYQGALITDHKVKIRKFSSRCAHPQVSSRYVPDQGV